MSSQHPYVPVISRPIFTPGLSCVIPPQPLLPLPQIGDGIKETPNMTLRRVGELGLVWGFKKYFVIEVDVRHPLHIVSAAIPNPNHFTLDFRQYDPCDLSTHVATCSVHLQLENAEDTKEMFEFYKNSVVRLLENIRNQPGYVRACHAHKNKPSKT